MSKRILLVASDRGFAENVRAKAARVGLGCEIAAGEMDSILAIRSSAPDVIVICDHPSRRALATCDVIAPIARTATLPVLVVLMDDVSDRDIVLHREGGRSATRYLRAASGIDEMVRVTSLLIRHTINPDLPARPPPVPANVSAMSARMPAIHGGGAGGAAARALATAPARNVALNGPERTESGVQSAIRPETSTQRLPDVSPSALEFEAARREAAEARRIREALERRATESEQRAADSARRVEESERRERDAREALERAQREREESDASWSAWVNSAEQFADRAWKERDALARTLGETQRALTTAGSEIELARSALERERARSAEIGRERDVARTELERSRNESRQFASRVETLEREVDRDRKTATQLDRVRERAAALEDELEQVQTTHAGAISKLEQRVVDATSSREQVERSLMEACSNAESAVAENDAQRQALESKITEISLELTRREEEANVANETLTTLRAQIAQLETGQAEAVAIAEQLTRAQRVIRHLLEEQQKSRANRDGTSEANQNTMRLCNTIIETQDRRITVLEKIATTRPIDPTLVAESRRLQLELEILLANLGRAPTSRH